MKVETKKHYKIKPIGGIWLALVVATIVIGVLMLFGVPIPLFCLFLPLGIPILAIVGLPLYALVAIVVVVLLALAFLLVGLIPILVLMILFGVAEEIDDLDLLN